MESTRSKILDILRLHPEATVDDLTTALGLAQATVRRHLDILQRDGFVKVRPVRRETGRPHYAFSITETGENLVPQHYVRITHRLIDEIMALAPSDTAGKSGRQLAAVIFERMAERMAQAYAPRVTGRTLPERVAQVTRLLGDEGIALEAIEEGGGIVLIGHGCPCARLADKGPDLCAYDRHLIARLLDAEVQPLAQGWPAGASCAYAVRERAPAR